MKLLGEEWVAGRLERWWLHVGDDGKDRITVETVQDVEPVFHRVERQRSMPQGKDMQPIASIPATVLEEVCRLKAIEWAASIADVFRELMQNKTDRAAAVWATLCGGRDYRKFQTRG